MAKNTMLEYISHDLFDSEQDMHDLEWTAVTGMIKNNGKVRLGSCIRVGL
jgi:hypothetical protein